MFNYGCGLAVGQGKKGKKREKARTQNTGYARNRAKVQRKAGNAGVGRPSGFGWGVIDSV